MFDSVFFSGLVYTMFFVYILHACFYSEVFLLLPTHTLIKKNYLHLLVLHKRWEVRAVRQRWHRAYAEVAQARRWQSFTRATGWIGQMDANEIGPGIVCGTGAGCSGGVGTSKKAFPSVIRLVKSDFCDVWC